MPQGVEFYAVQKPGSHGQLPSTLSSLKTITVLPGSEQIPASPAVAIWDRSGKLAYFGPYSEGLTCNSSNSFIEPILQALNEGRAVNATHTLAVGCYCPWPVEQRSKASQTNPSRTAMRRHGRSVLHSVQPNGRQSQ